MAYVRKVSTKQRKNGKPVSRYEVRWTEPRYDPQTGQPVRQGQGRVQRDFHQETYPTLEDANARKAELDHKHNTQPSGTPSPSQAKALGATPFATYAYDWLASLEPKVARGKLKRRTVTGYRAELERYALRTFGATPIAAITPRDCERFAAELTGKGLSPRTFTHAWSVFDRVLRYALRHDAIPATPTSRTEAASSGSGPSSGDTAAFEPHPLTARQVGALVAAIAADATTSPDALAVEFLAYSGLRASELAGLNVGDLSIPNATAASTNSPNATAASTNSPNATISVRRTRRRKAGEWETGTPKSRHSRRTVPLPDWLAGDLRQYLDTTHPRAADPDAPLFPGRKVGGARQTGKSGPTRVTTADLASNLDWQQPINPGPLYETTFKAALRAVGLPESVPATDRAPATKGVRLHDLRHTFATMQLMAGVHYMQVSRWLGHASFTITLNVYADWIPEDDGGNGLPRPPQPAHAPAHEPAPQPAEASATVLPFRGRDAG